jgi:hypothetical protein
VFENLSFMESVIKQTRAERGKSNAFLLKFGSTAVACLLLLGFLLQNGTFFGLGGFAIVVIIAMIIAFNSSGRLKTYESGIKGELLLKEKLKQILTSEYAIFCNFPAAYGDIDAVVVGPQGVYVLEAKHHNGHISVNGDEWNRTKEGRGGTVYSAEIGNPEKQAKRNAVYLKYYLLEKGIDLWVDHAVVLTNSEVQMSVKYNSHVFHVSEADRIFSGRQVLSDKKVEQIKSVLKKNYVTT